MISFLQINPLPSNSSFGPNVNLSVDVGTLSVTSSTILQLMTGSNISMSSAASQVTVTSTGTCTNSLGISLSSLGSQRTIYALNSRTAGGEVAFNVHVAGATIATVTAPQGNVCYLRYTFPSGSYSGNYEIHLNALAQGSNPFFNNAANCTGGVPMSVTQSISFTSASAGMSFN